MFPESKPPKTPFFFGAGGAAAAVATRGFLATGVALAAGPFRVTTVVVVVEPCLPLVMTVVVTLVLGVTPAVGGAFVGAAGRGGRDAGRPVVAGGPVVLFDGACTLGLMP